MPFSTIVLNGKWELTRRAAARRQTLGLEASLDVLDALRQQLQTSYNEVMRPLVKHVLSVLTAVVAWSASARVAKPHLELVRVVAQLMPNAESRYGADFIRFRQRLGTRLKSVGAAPDLYKDPAVGEGMRLARYPSEGGELKIWQLFPKHNQLWSHEGYPTIIYIHDGTSFGDDELAQAQTFSDAGFMVLAPTFRGENGNPGAHELLFGELDDLVAATSYVSRLTEVDKRRIALWGHGLGGMLSALASLVPKLRVSYTGSSAGLRPSSAFEVLQKPFEDSEQERGLRLLGPNIQYMRTPHVACVAERDPAVYDEALRLGEIADQLKLPLRVERVPGDRTSGRSACLQHAAAFLLQTLPVRTGGSAATTGSTE